MMLKLGLFAFLAAVCQSADFCSLRAIITDGDGHPASAPVFAVDSAGRRYLGKEVIKGLVEICDLGLKPVELVVGADDVAQVVVRKLYPFWGYTLEVKVTYQPYRLSHSHDPSCSRLVRVADERGAPISNATVSIGRQDHRSDKYGRVLVTIAYDADPASIVSAPGFRTTPLEISRCGLKFELVDEQDVILRRR